MEGYALSALLGVVFTGAGAWLAFGRNTMTRREHAEYCSMAQEPREKDITYLKEGQVRVEQKVDDALEVLHKMNGDV